MKKFLFVMRSTPHQGVILQEKLDIILTTAAFDQSVALLFLDEGVWQLKKNQQAELEGLKETSAIFNALEMYDVTELHVEAESLAERGVSEEDLSLSVNVIERKAISLLMQQFDVILSG